MPLIQYEMYKFSTYIWLFTQIRIFTLHIYHANKIYPNCIHILNFLMFIFLLPVYITKLIHDIYILLQDDNINIGCIYTVHKFWLSNIQVQSYSFYDKYNLIHFMIIINRMCLRKCCSAVQYWFSEGKCIELFRLCK